MQDGWMSGSFGTLVARETFEVWLLTFAPGARVGAMEWCGSGAMALIPGGMRFRGASEPTGGVWLDPSPEMLAQGGRVVATGSRGGIA